MNRRAACTVRAFPLSAAYPRLNGSRLKRIRPLSYGISIPCSSWCRCVFLSCSRIRTVIYVCASTVKKPLLQAGKGMSFAARSARTRLMYINQGKRKGKGKTNQATARKYLQHFGDCGILNIKKDICANRCPTGATDRRLARLVNYEIAVSFSRGRLFLCFITILTDRVSYSKAGQAEAQHCN